MAETVKVKYVGTHTEGVRLDLPNGERLDVAHGATVAVPAGRYAEGLLVQAESWQPVGAAAKEVASEIEAAQESAAPQKKGG